MDEVDQRRRDQLHQGQGDHQQSGQAGAVRPQEGHRHTQGEDGDRQHRAPAVPGHDGHQRVEDRAEGDERGDDHEPPPRSLPAHQRVAPNASIGSTQPAVISTAVQPPGSSKAYPATNSPPRRPNRTINPNAVYLSTFAAPAIALIPFTPACAGGVAAGDRAPEHSSSAPGSCVRPERTRGWSRNVTSPTSPAAVNTVRARGVVGEDGSLWDTSTWQV